MQHHPHRAVLPDVAAGLAHEFNNLLGAIQGFAGLIIEETGDGSLAGRHAARIIDAGRCGMELVERLVLASGRCRLDREGFDLSDWIKSGASELAGTLPPHATLQVADAPAGMMVDGDRKLLFRALASLCLNACVSLEGRAGRVTLDIRPAVHDVDVVSLLSLKEKSRRSDVDLHDDGEWVWAVSGEFRGSPEGWACVIVTDTGTGMTGEELGGAFDQFSSTRGSARHSGLGLPAACGIAGAHGGGVVVKSSPRYGTTVRLVLPLSGAPQ